MNECRTVRDFVLNFSKSLHVDIPLTSDVIHTEEICNFTAWNGHNRLLRS